MLICDWLIKELFGKDLTPKDTSFFTPRPSPSPGSVCVSISGFRTLITHKLRPKCWPKCKLIGQRGVVDEVKAWFGMMVGGEYLHLENIQKMNYKDGIFYCLLIFNTFFLTLYILYTLHLYFCNDIDCLGQQVQVYPARRTKYWGKCGFKAAFSYFKTSKKLFRVKLSALSISLCENHQIFQVFCLWKMSKEIRIRNQASVAFVGLEICVTH